MQTKVTFALPAKEWDHKGVSVTLECEYSTPGNGTCRFESYNSLHEPTGVSFSVNATTLLRELEDLLFDDSDPIRFLRGTVAPGRDAVIRLWSTPNDQIEITVSEFGDRSEYHHNDLANARGPQLGGFRFVARSEMRQFTRALFRILATTGGLL